MLLDRASVLAEKINSYQTLKNTADVSDTFAIRAQQFGSVSLKILGLRQTLTALEDAGVQVNFEPGDGVGYADKARALREGVNADPATLEDPPFNLKHDFNARLSQIVDAGKEEALATWTAYVETRAAFGADDVLRALAQIPQFRASVLKIEQIRSEVAAIGTDLPSNPKAAIAKLDELVILHEETWTKLEASEIPTSVISFIRAAAGAKAMLGDFTPEVQSWLEGRNLLDAFRIKLR